MPKVKNIENKVKKIEGFSIDIIDKDGKNVRDDTVLPKQYEAQKMTRNSMTVAGWKAKFQRQFPGYDVIVYKEGGNKASGQTKLFTVRDTYLED